MLDKQNIVNISVIYKEYGIRGKFGFKYHLDINIVIISEKMPKS